MSAAPTRLPGLVVSDHEFSVPLDHGDPGGERITVFAREVAGPEGLDKPFLVFLQGGPGFEAPRPTGIPASPGWLGRALADFRVLMLDQRGTGRSAPVGTLEGRPPAEQAEYLRHFRADAIVRDAEWIRRELGVERWSVLGQSFGGLCATTYLSLHPDALREVLITGGLPPLDAHIDDVYRATYERVRERERAHLARYPGDRERLERAAAARVTLPGGDVLSARRLRQIGRELGMSDGSENVHHLLELDPASPAFRHDAEAMTSFARNPLYAVVHEACWADGHATRWSAQRLLPDDLLLTGEHVYPWMFSEQAALAPLREAAELLAEHEWPRLYDPEALARNEVPVAAAIYANDLYVERRYSEETARRIPNLRTWVTDEFEHNGLRVDGERILGRLLDLVRGRA